MTAPILRFKDQGRSYPDWVQKKLKDCVTFSKGGSLSKSDLSPYGATPCLLYGELYTTYGEVTEAVINKTDSTEDLVKSQMNDVILPMSGETAEDIAKATCIKQEGVAYGGDLMVLRSKSLDGCFLSYSLNSINRRQISRIAQGKTVVHINPSRVSDISINIACLEEQQKIAAFFTALDEKISLTMEKISSIRKINNKLVADVLDGGIRFSSTNGQSFPDWKREKLGKSFSVKMCKRIFKEETLDKGDVPFYKIGTFGGKADSYITNELFESYKKKYSYPSKGDTLISCSGTVGRCVIFDGSPAYFQDSNIVWLEPNDKKLDYNKSYLTSVLENLRWDNLSSSTIKRIYSKDLLEKEWFIPCLDEQRMIAKFISTLNKKLAIENEKLSSLIKLKTAFMQQMFV